MPSLRLEMRPKAKAAIVATASPITTPTQGLYVRSVPPSDRTRFAIVKPAIPKIAACPSETMPP